MKKIGISIYPEKSNYSDDCLYITKAADLGYSRLFISLLEITGNQKEILDNFKKIIFFAKDKGLEVVLDVNPSLFKQLDISYSDLSFFAQLGADAIRLDLGFSGVEEAQMTHNPYDLKIEINMSHGTNYLENIMTRRPRYNYLIGSHNFYPHKYTGLDYNYFVMCCEKFREQNVATACFINSHSATFGPWPMQEGICTLEHHRNLSLQTQAAQLLFSNLIDCVIIGNAYASDEELQILSSVANMKTLPIRIHTYNLSDIEHNILFANNHIYRGEISPYMFRTKSDSRKLYADYEILPKNNVNIDRGDILIDNSLYMQYKGEMQIAKMPRQADKKVNVVGKIFEDDLILLDTLKPWDSFHLEPLG